MKEGYAFPAFPTFSPVGSGKSVLFLGEKKSFDI